MGKYTQPFNRWAAEEAEELFADEGEHKYAKLLREMYWYCPNKYRDRVWQDGNEHWNAMKEHEILHRLYTESGFYKKLRDRVDQWKKYRLEPRVVLNAPNPNADHKRSYDKKPVVETLAENP